jgi:pyruvate/2-oxoglutarate dehydrogenase complex dihydrolipoamide dehydrogenase (E3) component
LGRVVVCGGGLSGCESALALAMEGCDVTVVDMIPEDNFATAPMDITRAMLLMLLEEHKVNKVGDNLIRSIDRDGVHIEGRDWKYRTLEADYVVDALGMQPNSALAESFKELIPTSMSSVTRMR